mgnify:FL=1
MNNKFLIFLITSQIYSQLWIPFHPNEKENHNHYIISYELADSVAKNKQIHSNRFQLTHEVVGYLPYWEYHEYPELDYSLISQINYFSAELNQFGDIIDSNNWENLYFIEFAQSQGVKVKLCATLFNSSSLSTLLDNYFYRQNAINNLLNAVLQAGADGIDIDFENLPSSQKDNLVLFMEELSATFHSVMEDPIITMAIPAIDWSNAWDIQQLIDIVDGLFIMGYNYFYSGSQSAGPVSPLGGYFYDLNYSVNDYISKSGNQTDKLILGLPYYGYDWPVANSSINSNTLDFGSAKTFADYKASYSEYNSYWDNSSSTAWISYMNGNTNSWNQYWFDNPASLARKYEFAKSKNLSGVGIWALGYDDDYPDLWDTLYNSFINEMHGDVNNDFNINVQDILLVVDVIINNVTIDNSTDFNSDNFTDILDILYLVNIILNQ